MRSSVTNDVMMKQKMQYPPNCRRSATAPLTIVADVMQNAHWKNLEKHGERATLHFLTLCRACKTLFDVI